jgi:VanZ family protein
LTPVLKLRLVFILYVAGVIALSLRPGGDISTPGQTDKIAHFLAYAGMSFLALLAFRTNSTRAAALIFVVILGLFLEWVQLFVDGRSASLLDAAVNILGIAAGALLYRFRGRSLEKRISA